MCRHLRNPDAQDFEVLWKRDCILVTLFPLIPDSAHAHPNKEDLAQYQCAVSNRYDNIK